MPEVGTMGINPSTITIKGVEYSTELTELVLEEAYLTDVDIEPLKYMVNLTKLALFRNQISDISPLAGLTNLTWLSLTDNQISDISPLAGLTNLTNLYLLGNNQIRDISPLAGLTNLTQLDLYGNQVSDVNPLAELTNLTFLGLAKNEIKDINILEKLTNLIYLSIDDNPLLNYEQIEKLKEALPNLNIISTKSEVIVDGEMVKVIDLLDNLNEVKQAIEEESEIIEFRTEPDLLGLGGILLLCENITLGEIKELFNDELCTRISVAPPVPPYIKGEPVVITEEQLKIIVIDEDYTLPKGKTLWLSVMTKLKVAEGVTFTVEGTVEAYQEPIIEGKIIGYMETEYDIPTHDLDGNLTGYINKYIIGENANRY